MWLAMGWPCTVTPYSTSVPITRRTLTPRAYDSSPDAPDRKDQPMDPVQAQVDAYNARDIDAFIAAYASDVVITDPSGTPMLGGHEAMRDQYGALFEGSPDLRAE